MDMKRIEAPTLEEAYKKAAREFNCSITEINYEIVQYPSNGVMGLFKKRAIIVAVKKLSVIEKEKVDEVIEEENNQSQIQKQIVSTSTPSSDVLEVEIKSESDNVLDSFFETSNNNDNNSNLDSVLEEDNVEKYSHKFDDDRDSPENRAKAKEIENKLKNLMDISCFDIDVVEVDVFNNIAHIFIDGEDAALLIGKEGYRYNALSYMLFNWINAYYGLYIKLEIAEFIQTQEEMIKNYLKPIIEHINENGRGKTKPLDGILVQIALEQLRAEFPNKYVAIKTAKDNRKFIIINNFNSTKNG
jgi:spoIIIJ-associated protein